MNIFDRIKQDHEKQRRLMQQIADTAGDSEQRRELFAEFLAEYKSHAAAEEHAFYAPMMKVQETTDQSRHSVAEHAEAMEIVEKLEATDMSSPAWLVTFKGLLEENEHHMEEEEEEVFPLARTALEDAVIEGMLEQFESRKSDEIADNT